MNWDRELHALLKRGRSVDDGETGTGEAQREDRGDTMLLSQGIITSSLLSICRLGLFLEEAEENENPSNMVVSASWRMGRKSARIQDDDLI